MTDSQQLLADYAKHGSETAFRELVARYINFVYSTALRLVNGDTHLAQDVTQIVFINLAKKCRAFSSDVMLGGWLHRHTYHVATRAMRAERRRQFRETEAMQMNALTDDSETSLRKVAPLLDEAITQLGAEDRAAILLRFFEQRDFRAIGATLGSNEDAARMRVNRALEKLHVILKRRGIALSVAALGTALASEAVTAAPVGLAANVAGTAFATATATGATATLIKLMTMTKLQATIIGVVAVAGLIAPLAIQHQSQIKLRARDEALQQQSVQLAALTAENVRLSNQMSQAKESQALSQNQLNDLLKLRNEVGALKKQLADAARLQLQPAPANSPAPLDPLEEQRQAALLQQERLAKMTYAKRWLLSFMKYADKNQGQFPPTFELSSAFIDDDSKEETLLATNQFEIVYHGSLYGLTNASETIVLREITAPGATLKTYGFADGHVQIHKVDNGDFAQWEAQHLAAPPQ